MPCLKAKVDRHRPTPEAGPPRPSSIVDGAAEHLGLDGLDFSCGTHPNGPGRRLDDRRRAVSGPRRADQLDALVMKMRTATLEEGTCQSPSSSHTLMLLTVIMYNSRDG